MSGHPRVLWVRRLFFGLAVACGGWCHRGRNRWTVKLRFCAGQSTLVQCNMISACLLCFVTVNVATGDELRPLFRAIRTVETSGGGSPSRQVGDGGRSLGPYQISYRYWADSGVRGRWAQCYDRRYSETVMLAYWNRHCPNALRQRNAEVLARIHNGGPEGCMKGATWGYWQKVKRTLHEKTSSAKPRLARSF